MRIYLLFQAWPLLNHRMQLQTATATNNQLPVQLNVNYNSLCNKYSNNIVDLNTQPLFNLKRIYLHILNGQHHLKGSVCKRLAGMVFLGNKSNNTQI